MSDPGAPQLRGEKIYLRPKVQEADLPMEFAKRALTYLEAAERLLTHLEDGSWPPNYYSGQVVLMLLNHSAELFLKSFIKSLQPTRNVTGHSLRELADNLHALDASIKFSPPFEVEALVTYPELMEEAVRDNRRLHEHFRYPTNNAGEPWPGMSALTVEGCRRVAVELRAQCEELCTRFFP